MNYFKWGAIQKEIQTAYEVDDNWLVTLYCDPDGVFKIAREPTKRISDCPTVCGNMQQMIDIQRMLADGFCGQIYIEGQLGDITRVWKREVKKP